MKWYRKLPTPGRKNERLRYAAVSDTPTERTRKPLARRIPDAVFFKKYCSIVSVNGYRFKVMSRYQIAQLFGLRDTSTIIKWDRLGVLPEPFMYLQRRTKYPVYLSSQIRCLVMVVNDLLDERYVAIPWQKMPQHVEMLHEGYSRALDAFEKRSGMVETAPKGDRFGVEFFD
jgi:hypothetical protein